MAKKQKYVVRKYDGDDEYSYAVFKKENVIGLRSPIFYAQAKPDFLGLSIHSAKAIRDRLNKEE